MVMEAKYGQMEQDMKVTILMEKKAGREYYIFKMDQNMKETSKIMIYKVTESIFGPIIEYILVTSL